MTSGGTRSHILSLCAIANLLPEPPKQPPCTALYVHDFCAESIYQNTVASSAHTYVGLQFQEANGYQATLSINENVAFFGR